MYYIVLSLQIKKLSLTKLVSIKNEFSKYKICFTPIIIVISIFLFAKLEEF